MKDDRLYLHHMVGRRHRISRFIAAGRDAFMASEQLQDAVIRNVELIGEAAKRVSADARDRMASLDWKAICGLRDVLIHDYIGVDLDEVWNAGSSRIPVASVASSSQVPCHASRNGRTRALGMGKREIRCRILGAWEIGMGRPRSLAAPTSGPSDQADSDMERAVSVP